jgi:FixJ family two-component response regulator
LSKPPLLAIVDDDLAVREALFDFLEVEGLRARTFESAAALLADDDLDAFDCIVTDVRMPAIDGLELQRILRARGSAVPMIFITSSQDENARQHALSLGARAWFTKPVANQALLQEVRSVTGQGEN